MGLCTKAEAVLQFKPGVVSYFRQKRQVAFALLPLIDDEINRLEKLGVVKRVDLAQCSAPIVVVQKANGGVRICPDFSIGLNDALEPHQFPLTLTEEICISLQGGKYFSTIDLSDAYLQVKVSEDLQQLLTVNTHQGLLQYQRLPLGVKNGPGTFQQITSTMLTGLKGVVPFIDDIIKAAESIEQHRHILELELQCIQEWGFKLNYEKFRFFQPQVRFLGFVFDSSGRRPDRKRISAIAYMPEPEDTIEVRSFLGMLNFYSQFIANVRISRPIDNLLKKNVKFRLSDECHAAFNKAKEAKEIIVAGDALKDGIGGVMVHRFPDGSK
ncbi:uncharacterized protein K02A2.6-like [Eupeodes corollae]|uniref:uncharacterized protein K02A2.6-like n=1 Tax=Eupeodes corollae TaxID=290404 RepID=UPI002491FE47|nr:uncharacterized protein K02A2.6-like [Eupeodes corollae]